MFHFIAFVIFIGLNGMGRTSTAAVAVVSSWQDTLPYYIFIS
jgi:hypothetical protein